MAAVNERKQLNAARTSVIEQRVERGARSTARIEHVVHQDDVFVLDIELHFLRAHLGTMPDRGKVVAVERNVESADRDSHFFDPPQNFGETLRQRNTAALDANQAEIVGPVVLLDN